MLLFFRAFVIAVIALDFLILCYTFVVAFKDTMALSSKNATDGMVSLLIAVEIVIGMLLAITSRQLAAHLLPLTPLFTRGAVSLVFNKFMSTILTDEVKQRQDIRTIVLAFMGFSSASLLALTVVEARAALMSFYPVYYMLISFIGFYLALNIQSYKNHEWQGQLGAVLLDVGTLSFLLSVVSIFRLSGQNNFYKNLFTGLALGAWLIDHLIRLIEEKRVYQDKS
jgi:hypothetical protein